MEAGRGQVSVQMVGRRRPLLRWLQRGRGGLRVSFPFWCQDAIGLRRAAASSLAGRGARSVGGSGVSRQGHIPDGNRRWNPGGTTTALVVVVPVSPGTQDLWTTTDRVEGKDLLAGDLLASTDSSNFEGFVRFKVDPPSGQSWI